MKQQERNKEVNQFSHGEIIPESIYHAITLHTSHIHQMVIAYNRLCFAAKENKLNKPLPKNDEFENLIKDAFDGRNSITSIGFIEYVEKFILDTPDNLLLEKVYNILNEKINELIRQPKRLRFNPVYPHYNSLFENTSHKMILYIIPLGHELDANGNYKEVKDYFTVDNLFDAIVQDLKETKQKIDSLFSLKKLNDKTLTVQNSTSPKQPQMQIEPIIWDTDNILLGYLIQWLKDNGFISKKTGRDAAIKNHFSDPTGKPITNIKQGLNNMKKYNDGALPKDFEKIEPLLNTLKELKELF